MQAKICDPGLFGLRKFEDQIAQFQIRLVADLYHTMTVIVHPDRPQYTYRIDSSLGKNLHTRHYAHQS